MRGSSLLVLLGIVGLVSCGPTEELGKGCVSDDIVASTSTASR